MYETATGDGELKGNTAIREAQEPKSVIQDCHGPSEMAYYN